jgi:hypothetical protein
MSTQMYGLTSLGLIGVAVAIAAVALCQLSGALALVYLAGSVLLSGGVIYAFCAKCPCRKHCGHVLPGKLAVTFTNRPTEPYTLIELAVVAVMGLAALGAPLLWLWRFPLFLGAFGLLILIALIQIRTVLCRACNNHFCPGNKGFAVKK